ncbi:helix-turn-helix domain-containing protein [Rhizobium straminoryzae]|uniref:Helix-turn-helix domain-containing protein n=1 Tax=Rhizobium straminoryzae TaxID=1387186 RepID=A0A549SZM4_9HYPH|nr:helix-turn-helix domain-containing protein [Rhizobium straminoryzae]TRL35045.1 helix-turn-helix domain-containing protein [Rhizobium straminoryzae]
MAGRRPNRRAIKRHYSYTSEEAAAVLGVAKGSVRRWLKAGLPHIADQRPFLILGGDLRDFLDKRDKPKQRCGLGEFFCFRCREPKGAAGGLIDYTPRTVLSGQLSAICETCETIMHKNFSASKLGLLERQAAVSFPQGDPRLNEMGIPRRNDHFRKGAKA